MSGVQNLKYLNGNYNALHKEPAQTLRTYRLSLCELVPACANSFVRGNHPPPYKWTQPKNLGTKWMDQWILDQWTILNAAWTNGWTCQMAGIGQEAHQRPGAGISMHSFSI